LVPNALQPQWLERGDRGQGAAGPRPRRPIDVLVQERKNSRYVLERLVPELRRAGLRVEVQSGWVDDLVDLFNDATVVLYDSADYWRGRGVSEGFGLPPLEALACGCVVFSSLNHALADTLDPGLLGHQIGCGTIESDLQRIRAAVADPGHWQPEPQRLQQLLHEGSEPVLRERWAGALAVIDQHWRQVLGEGALPLAVAPRWRLRWDQLRARVQAKVRS
jgi:glycosyltransferase involved in cell wall biosynthesis